MKKVFLFAIAITALSFASCSNKGTAESTVETDTTTTVVEEVETIVPDSADTTAIVDEVAVEETVAK
jgi:hypothetical protein